MEPQYNQGGTSGRMILRAHFRYPCIQMVVNCPRFLDFHLKNFKYIHIEGIPLLLHPSRQLIYNYPEQLFSDAGVMAIEHADFDGIEQLALVLGGEIVSTFGNPEKVKLGTCKLIEEIMIGEDKVRGIFGGGEGLVISACGEGFFLVVDK